MAATGPNSASQNTPAAGALSVLMNLIISFCGEARQVRQGQQRVGTAGINLGVCCALLRDGEFQMSPQAQEHRLLPVLRGMYIHRTTYLLVEGHDAGYHRIPVPAIRLLLLPLLAFLLHSSTRQLLSKASVDCEQTRGNLHQSTVYRS